MVNALGKNPIGKFVNVSNHDVFEFESGAVVGAGVGPRIMIKSSIGDRWIRGVRECGSAGGGENLRDNDKQIKRRREG